jgi:peptidoglycan hydrolase-like protein with peptidoglycan-binding domain
VPLIAPKPPKPPQPPKPQSRTGGTAGGQFAALHPRGRGGKWIVKPGDGYGSKGPSQTTAQLQQRLNQLGFKVPVDGQYGPQTAAAVQAFQKRYGLASNFGVDAATQALLQNPPAQSLAAAQRARGINPSARTARSRSSTSKITPAQAAQQVTVSADAKAAIKAGVDAASQAHQARVDTTVATARHDAQQARNDAAAAKKDAQAAKAAAVGGSAQAQRTARSAERSARSAERNAKGAVKALNSLKKQIAKQKATRIARAQSPLAGEVAVLARGPVHVHAATGGKTMKLTPVKKGSVPKSPTGKVQVATSAELPAEKPGLEETTLTFGYGGDPSNPIPDGREQTPITDQPIWTRFGARIPPVDYTIKDGRDTPPASAGETPEAALKVLLSEAVAARKAATTGAEFTRAFAREQVLRARIAEGLFDEARHPRGRGGKWVEVLNKLMGGGGAPARLHLAHLEDMGDDYLNARLHPDSNATDAERSKIREIQRRRATRLRRAPSAQRPLAKVQRPLAQVQRPLSQVQKPLSKVQRSLSDVQKPLY